MVDEQAADDGTETETERQDALAEHTVELSTTDPTVDFEDQETVGNSIGDGRIIALGEATHGTREFFRLKHRFLRYLVEHRDVRVFALEANLPETLALNEYVVYGQGDPREALDGIYFWTWNVESILTMVEWLRGFNEGRPESDRVRFYGFDAQYTTGAVDFLREFFESAEISVPTELLEGLETIDDNGENPDQDDEIETRLSTGEQVVAMGREYLQEHRQAYVNATDESAWELALQQCTVLEQALAYRQKRVAYADSDDDEETLEELLYVRDRAMADNVDWLLGFESAHRIVLWAHDAHINRSKHVVRGTDVSSRPMGSFLAERHGAEYVPLGFSFARGSFQAYGEVADSESGYELQGHHLTDPPQETIDATLDELGYPLALLNLREARTDDRLAGWLEQPQRHFSAGATYEPGQLEQYITEYEYDEAFDAVCFVRDTTRARPVDEEVPQ